MIRTPATVAHEIAEAAFTDPSDFRDFMEELIGDLASRWPAPFGQAAQRFRAGLLDAMLDYDETVDNEGRWNWTNGTMAEPELPFGEAA